VTKGLLGGGVGICLLLCGFVGYHVCVTRPRRRRRLLLQDVEFKVHAAAGAKQYVPASPPLQWGVEGAEDTGRRTGEGKRFLNSRAVRVLGLFPRSLSWDTCYIATLGSLRYTSSLRYLLHRDTRQLTFENFYRKGRLQRSE
jgi:hypothetical protein